MFFISVSFGNLKVWGGMVILANKSRKPHPHPISHTQHLFSKGYLYNTIQYNTIYPL